MESQTEEYLRSINVLAQKIGQDLDTAREAYQELWFTLNDREKQQVLDEAIIDPAAVLKYSNSYLNVNESQNLQTVSNFSWFTKSQLNLFSDILLKGPKTPSKKTEVPTNHNNNNQSQDKPVTENKIKENNLLNKIKNKVTNLKIPASLEEKQNLVESKQATTVVKSLSKPKTPPPPPPTKPGMSEKKALLSVDYESDHEDIPKTGFDFLDNW